MSLQPGLRIEVSQQIEQKVRDSFDGYPQSTQFHLSEVLATQYKLWQAIGNRLQSTTDLLSRNVVEYGQAYSPVHRKIDIPKKPLNDDELSAYQQFSAVLDGMDLHNDNHGYSSEGKPNTRFYLSLKDGLPAIEFMTTFVGQLDNMYRNGSIPFFQFKFGSDKSEQGVVRFDHAYLDKESVILKVSDKDVPLTRDLIEQLSNANAAQIFCPQKAPFKFSSDYRQFQNYHISMEVGMNDRGGQLLHLGIGYTPEQGMQQGITRFLSELGLTKEWEPMRSKNPRGIRESWEKAAKSVWRDPQKPWITIDREPVEMLTQ